MAKKIAVYGSYQAKLPVTYKQRYWKRRKDSIKQRYWKKVTRTQKATKTGRYELTGKGKDLYKAVVIAQRLMPNGFVTVSAEEFLQEPYEYGFEGKWIEQTVES
jgi:hypothetical protein